MDSGFYAACAGLRAQTQTLEMVANNLANLNTTGFRAHEATFRSLLAGNAAVSHNALNRAVNDFGVLGGSRVDLHAGNLGETGNPLDLAIEGEGFFAVQGRGQVLYTRNGNFRVSSSGQLITSEGDPVLGEQGLISVSSGQVAVGADGTLSVDGAIAGKLRVAAFAPGTSLRAVGSTYYAAPENAAPTAATGSSIRQGMLESSNVNAVAGTIALIAVQRQAEMLQRALSMFATDFNHIAASELPRL